MPNLKSEILICNCLEKPTSIFHVFASEFLKLKSDCLIIDRLGGTLVSGDDLKLSGKKRGENPLYENHLPPPPLNPPAHPICLLLMLRMLCQC